MRVLIVEDEPTIASQLAAALGQAGYAVDCADNGVDALALGGSEPVDAVILDLGLPRIDGLTVLKTWRAAGRTMPVLILTARDNWHEKVAGIDAGSFARAADRLGRSTSAVSAQLKKLEEQAGAPLVRKSGRGLTLTEVGYPADDLLAARAEQTRAHRSLDTD